MNSNKTQAEQVLKYLEKHVGMTTLDAFEKFGITRLSARIFELRDRGYKILSTRVPVKNRFGKECYVARYSLVKEKL